MTGTRRMLPAFAVGLLGLVGMHPAEAVRQQRSVTPDAAPPSWLAYAGKVNGLVTGWLRGPDEAAVRLRDYMDAQRPAADRSGTPLVLKLWIGRKGTIDQVDFSPFADAQPNADLRGLLIGKTIGALPPKGMLLPLRLSIVLQPAPSDNAAVSTPANTQP